MKIPTVNGIRCTMGMLRAFVINRDGMCLAWPRDPTHVCRDKWGRPHDPTDRNKLTLEHVPKVHSHLEGRRDNERHCVTLCHNLNINGPPQELRNELRKYLRDLYPTCSPEE